MISVIIPVYNNEKYVARCLDSLLAQTCQDFEVLAVNDGSTDRSGEIMREYAGKDKRFRCFEQENRGVSAARNKGLDNAKGEYIFFLDGDDWFDPDVLERLSAAMIKDNLDCVSYMFRHIYEDGTPVKEDGSGDDIHYRLSSAKESSRFFDTAARHVFYTSQLHLFKRNIIEENLLRFAEGIKCGEDELFAHMYSMFVRRGVILSSFNGYNYYHHAKSCLHVNREPWENVIGENMKCCTYFAQYLKETGREKTGGVELAARCWEFLLHVAETEMNFPDRRKMSSVLRSECVKRVVYSSLFHYASLRRRLLTLIFFISRKLFRGILGIRRVRPNE